MLYSISLHNLFDLLFTRLSKYDFLPLLPSQFKSRSTSSPPAPFFQPRLDFQNVIYCNRFKNFMTRAAIKESGWTCKRSETKTNTQHHSVISSALRSNAYHRIITEFVPARPGKYIPYRNIFSKKIIKPAILNMEESFHAQFRNTTLALP